MDMSHADSDSEDEAIVVTRQQERIDPEAEAEFEREYAKMMAESLESRKFERKPLFDVPLPVRGKSKETATGSEPVETGAPTVSTTMAFSLLTKKGNRQQVRIAWTYRSSNGFPDLCDRLEPWSFLRTQPSLSL